LSSPELYPAVKISLDTISGKSFRIIGISTSGILESTTYLSNLQRSYATIPELSHLTITLLIDSRVTSPFSV
jgi:hypothetical protein